MKIDCSALEQAVAQLEKSMGFLHSELARKNKDLYEQFRTASIKAFEYTYELALKMIRRQLEQIALNPEELREMAFMDFIRTAYEAGLIREVPVFKAYREKRNITAHTYDADKAEAILSILDSFLHDARYILEELKKRNSVS
ncbi:MAG: nucleotidyltransferase substrate binding protein [Candidatus Omnitrophica bacterium]|nr:nucleotidyltransferase substrate binding protein [Candidatus Omnitrophota bacterium]